ncbi:MAG: UDP-N-acetylglucosamine--N-acetylmuramyl-(pentapeptide) pyrophosphoryl-undecaprenol N-acetylglucosamine transferase [Candidatus Saccharimonadales bacterium]
MRKQRILAVGGGSGGHITPIVAVLHELQRSNEAVDVRLWCDRSFYAQAKNIMAQFDPLIRIDTIIAGKLRRYHHITFLQHVTIPSVLWPNIRDIFLVVCGVVQSIVKLIVWRPDVVFAKGGYVCLPVGWAARLLRIPLVIHDSDAHPGLTNRLLARSATCIATGAPLEYYSYPAAKSQYIGIPVADTFYPRSDAERHSLKKTLCSDADRPLVVVTGGGLGARVLNDEIMEHIDELLAVANVILISGRDQYDELQSESPVDDARFQLHAFVSQGMADMLAAADVVVSRAGATTLLELAALAKPTILVPNGRLTGGHQLKNAKVYSDSDAAVIVNDESFGATSSELTTKIIGLVQDTHRQQVLAANIHSFARPQAAVDMAAIIQKAIKKPA